MPLTFEQALETVREKLAQGRPRPATETLALLEARGRVVAEDVAADRDLPPFHRATRDGYAVRAADLGAVPAELDIAGEIRAGQKFGGRVEPGRCVAIMTGAPLPEGADAVVMLEQTRSRDTCVEVLSRVEPWDNVVRQGSEAAQGRPVLAQGRRLGAGELGLLAAVGKTSIQVFRAPGVAILPTGDEVVPLEQQPEWYQIRNSNAVTLAAQVVSAGGVPRLLSIAPDEKGALRRLIEAGLESDLLLLSGGVSAGKYDYVKEVMAELAAEFFLRGVAIRPGRPLVFGRARKKFFFGLPGNPVSTFVTFALFVRPALAMLEGADFERPMFLRARLGKPIRRRAGLTAFLPAHAGLEGIEPVVNLVGWQGSGDLVGVAAANAFLVLHTDQTELAAGDWVDVMRIDG